MKILVITDNEFIFNNFKKIILNKKYKKYKFDFRYSEKNNLFKEKFKDFKDFIPININKEKEFVIMNYNKIISLHCKQIFPSEIVNKISCINVHPGYNPDNRGWFPQVFSILNKKRVGVTVHYIDNELDHGKVIKQEEVDMFSWDTSLSLYNRIQKKEIEILSEYLLDILEEKITPYEVGEGNINYLKDFKKICNLNLQEKLTLGEVIDKLRALTHGNYKNAYFYDENNEKIFVKLTLEREESNE